MITFSSVTKQFGDETLALKNISFAIDPGELVIITGHSGSGKTTLMRLLTKEYQPTEGEIIFDGVSLSTIKPNKVHHHRRKIGVVFQDYKLLPELNVWENIALALNIIGKPQAETEARVSDLLRLVGLVDKAFLFPTQLSGGEAQRVSIARALATGPSVIFADEPTGNLDPETSSSIARLLKKINSLGTVVMIATHDSGVLETLKGERHLVLDKGMLVRDSGQAQTETSKPVAEPEAPASPSATLTPPTETETESELIEADEKSTEELPAKPKKKLKLPSLKLPFGKKKPPTEPGDLPAHALHDDKNDEDTVDITVKVEKL